jgi:predicted acylesterase/phospholipase RssA
MDTVKPLNWQAVVDSPIPLKVVASCLDTLQPVILECFDSPQDLKQCLRASAAVPVVAGDPITHRGRRLVDAAVFEAIPFRAAIADGCTHIIALPTRPPFKKADYFARWVDENVSQLVKRAVLSPDYMKGAWKREVEYQKAFGITPEELLVQSLEPGSHKLPAMAGCHVFPIFPGPAASYSPMCIDAATVMLGIAEGRSSVYKVLGTPKQAAAAEEQADERALLVKQRGAKAAPVTASTGNS